MKSHIKLFILVGIACFICLSFVASPVIIGQTTDSAEEEFEPYFAEITGNDVYIRTGPGQSYYEWSKLNEGDRVKVVGDQFGVWAKIEPPAGSFSWISMQYVEIDTDDPSYGIVTGDNVRVYAGSENLRPVYSTRIQGKMNKGDRVRLLGEQLDDYYKIDPPDLDNAYLWVSTDYVKPIEITLDVEPRLLVAPAMDPLQNEQENVMGQDQSPETVGPILETTEVVEPAEIEEPAVVVPTPEMRLEQYYSVQDKIEAERVKPFEEQDYSEIKSELLEIVSDNEAGKAARYAQAVIEQVESYELALEVGRTVKQQNEQLIKDTQQLEKAHSERISEIQDMGRYAVIGKLQNFQSMGQGYYRITDESGLNLCTAVPSDSAEGQLLSSFVGKKVGLIGTIEPYSQTSGALVRFTEVVNLEN